VWKILRDASRQPTPARTGLSWSKFVRSKTDAIIATDFFSVDTALLRRFYVLFFIEIGSRKVHLAGITTNPDGPWTTHQARNLLMRLDQRVRFVVHDGAGQYTASFDHVFGAVGAEAITTPAHPKPTRSPSDGCDRCATNCSTGPSSGTSTSSSRCYSST
jgi:putative transposase